MPPPQTENFRQAVFWSTWGIPFVYSIAVLARSSIIIVIPILAYRNLGEASLVSAIYLVASVGGLFANVALPPVLKAFGPWRMMIGASAIGLGAGMFFSIPGVTTLIAGLTLHFLMVQLFETVTNVYSLNAISRRDLARFESRRIMLAGFAYIVGPFIGAFLLEYGPHWSPFALSGVCAALVPVITASVLPNARTPVPPPLVAGATGGFAIRQFLRQPRLRLAWFLAIGRAGWWQMFFVYTPILAATGGIAVAQTGIIAGVVSALLLLAPLWNVVLHRLGLRCFFFATYAVCGVATVMTGVLAQWSFGWATAALIISAVAISGVDSAGNTPFMRAVKSRDRLRMVPIYNTYREMSQIVPATVYTLLLVVFGVSSVFLVSGAALVVMSLLCRQLPRRA